MSRDRTVSRSEEGHDPTADRADPRCPSCGEKVGARARYCIHCWRDLPERDDRPEYDDVTGASHEITYERESVTSEAGEVSARTPSVDDPDSGGATDRFLARLRAATSGSDAAELDAPPVPSGRGTDGPSLLPTLGIDRERTGRFLAGAGVAGALAVALGTSLPVAAALVAALAWVASTAWLARERSGFDAMRYGSLNLMVTVVFVSFAMAFAAGASPAVPLALAAVPVAVSALLVGGLGDTVAAYAPGPA